MARSSSGFTLLEILLALTIGAMVLAVLGELLGTAIHADHRLRATRIRRDSSAVGLEWLRMAFRNAEAGAAGDVRFDGRANQVRFSTRTPGPDGGHTQDVATIGVRDSAVTLLSQRLGSIRLVPGVRAARFDYLEVLGADSPWLPAYDSPVSPPLAVRVRLEREHGTDTLVFRTGIVP